MWKRVRHDKFHGRVQGSDRHCQAPGCDEPAEFRAPGLREPSFDGPGDYRWFCLDHVRAFNAGYDWFDGMSAEEILAAQRPCAGWERETRAFRPTAGIDSVPRWGDFADPLDAIAARVRTRRAEHEAGRRFSAEERGALRVLGLTVDCDRRGLRLRYSELVRRYHPDRNGGDRSFETRLQRVVEAYQLLRRADGFA